MKNLRVILDSNIIVSILKGSPKIQPIYSLFKEEKFKLIICSELLKELRAVLYRPHLKIDPRDVKTLFRVIKSKALRAKITPPFVDACRDPEDNFILEMAIKAKAHFIVTGDKDLLSLHPFRSVGIITPKEFIALFKK